MLSPITIMKIARESLRNPEGGARILDDLDLSEDEGNAILAGLEEVLKDRSDVLGTSVSVPLFGKAALETILVDQMTDDSMPQLKVRVEAGNGSIFVCPQGYSDSNSMDGQGSPILVEVADGKLRVVCWSDINEEDPTHIISMEKAREDLRIED